MTEFSPETLELIERMAERTATVAVEKALRALGVDTEHPTETQKDMAYARWSRTTAEQVSKAVIIAVITVPLTAIVTALVTYLRGGGVRFPWS